MSGLIYDLTHPAGWLVGIGLGVLLADPTDGPRPRDLTPLRHGEVPWLVVAAVAGTLAGIFVGHL